jgi:FtsZ-interacting cell division protein ZipA
MPELRWTLLILGVLFIAALAWWELRRPRQARGGREPHRDPEPLPEIPGESAREPSLALPEIRAREPITELPVLEVPEDSRLGMALDPPAHSPVPPSVRPPAPPLDEATIPVVSAAPDALLPQEVELPQEQPPEDSAPVAPGIPTEPLVEWPPEAARRIVALRVVAPPERFPGRALRQALAAEGFMLGKFEIYHRAGPDGRAVVSAASLNKPGTFDPLAMDMQRFGGLNLFAVLPGPLPPGRAFEELLGAARGLNERLQGALQDERGEPLTPTRLAALREQVAHESAGPGGP